MRAVLLVAFAAALAGCLQVTCVAKHGPSADCSYGVGPVAASAWFEDEAWNESALADAFVALGFTVDVRASRDVLSVNDARERLGAQLDERNASTILSIEFPPADHGIGLTQAEAQAELDAMEAAARPRAEALLAAFENETGWKADSGLSWMQAMSVR